VQENPLDSVVVGQYLKYAAATALLSQKLRLSVQSSTRLEAGILNEKSETPQGRKGKSDDLLFGANVIKF